MSGSKESGSRVHAVRIGGRRYRLGPLTLRDYDEIASRVLARRATAAEIDRWKRTPEGFCHLFWMMIRKHHPEVTLRRAAVLVEELAAEARPRVRRRMTLAEGLAWCRRRGGPQTTAQTTPSGDDRR